VDELVVDLPLGDPDPAAAEEATTGAPDRDLKRTQRELDTKRTSVDRHVGGADRDLRR
jgi:hypothetical protein